MMIMEAPVFAVWPREQDEIENHAVDQQVGPSQSEILAEAVVS